MKISKNKLIKYLFILSLFWSFSLLEPILLRSYIAQNTTKQDSTLGINTSEQENILTNRDLDFYDTIGQMSRTIAYALSDAGYSAQVYYDEATFVRTEKHLIIIGHGSEISDRYYIEDLHSETIARLASQFEFTALLACKSSEIMKSSQTMLSFEDDINTVDALMRLSEFLKIEVEVPKNMKVFNLYDPIPGLDPGPGGGGGDPLGEGWTSQTASVTYANIWYYFNLRTATGATEFDDFVQSHPSTKVLISCRGYFNYEDPEDSSAYGWIEYVDGALISVRLSFNVKIVWQEVAVSGGSEIHCFLVGLDYIYNGQTDPRQSYTQADLNDTECNNALMEFYNQCIWVCTTVGMGFTILALTAFIAGASVAAWSEVVIGTTTIMLSAFLLKLSLVLVVLVAVALILAVIFGVFWYLQTRSC
ncbi:MAG: hypothetical protein KGD64_02955 [Candidatus Heimdallarchaeota archaeon]|nr:hypothetical protein [Candidatus Heimdallarchaeota archaeon]